VDYEEETKINSWTEWWCVQMSKARILLAHGKKNPKWLVISFSPQ